MASDVAYRPKTGEIPTNPGVYRFADAAGRILYVGKAKNLRARLSTYFGPLSSLHERTRKMVTSAAGVTWTIVGSELEALQLEYTWIKEFDPPFNVVFRDDKSYPYLAVTMSEKFPRVMITREARKTGNRYFGPYVKVGAVRETIEFMLKAFPVRSCNKGTLDRAIRTGKPCLLGDIGKCAAPCVGRVTPEEHRAIARDFCDFMAGHDQAYIRRLKTEMKQASVDQRYEAAARYRDQLSALETVLARTAVVLPLRTNLDCVAIVDDELSAAVQLFIIRQGRVRGVKAWVVDKELELSADEFLAQALQNIYGDRTREIPAEILLPMGCDDATVDWLTTVRGGPVRVHVPQRGDKAALLATAEQNAAEALRLYKNKRTADYTVRSAALSELQQALGLPEAPLRIECFDISHLGGEDVVASMVVFEDGLPRKNQYRKFSVAGTRDDTESMHQVLSRRLARLREDGEIGDSTDADTAVDAGANQRDKRSFAYHPGLLLVDGGAPQVNAAQRAVAESGVPGIAVAGIAKRLEELWLPGSDYPVILPRNSEALFLVQRLRDEAHRFAITYQRSTRTKRLESRLTGIPGLGAKTATALLTHFGSLARIAQATSEQLQEVPGVGPRLAEVIMAELHESNNG